VFLQDQAGGRLQDDHINVYHILRRLGRVLLGLVVVVVAAVRRRLAPGVDFINQLQT
jgi:hypothetical protein